MQSYHSRCFRSLSFLLAAARHVQTWRLSFFSLSRSGCSGGGLEGAQQGAGFAQRRGSERNEVERRWTALSLSVSSFKERKTFSPHFFHPSPIFSLSLLPALIFLPSLDESENLGQAPVRRVPRGHQARARVRRLLGQPQGKIDRGGLFGDGLFSIGMQSFQLTFFSIKTVNRQSNDSTSSARACTRCSTRRRVDPERRRGALEKKSSFISRKNSLPTS